MTPALRALVRTPTLAALPFALPFALAAAIAAASVAPAQAAATDLQPEDLARGADISVAHIEDGDFVLGDRTVDVGGGRAHLLGRSGKAWLVGTSDIAGAGAFRIVRVMADDSTQVIKRGISFYEMTLSENGRFLVHVGRGTRRSVPLRVFSARTGEVKAEKGFANYPDIVAMAGPRVLLSTWTTGDTGVSSWDVKTGAITKISSKPANIVDAGNDLLATYSKDPYLGGCVRLGRLSSPDTTLWKSCSQRIVAFSPDGRRMATVPILSDGIGPGAVQEREIDGTLLGDYSSSWFGQVTFENNTDLLLEVNGDTQSATVRCSAGDCENATDPTKVQQPRVIPQQQVQRPQNMTVDSRVLSVKPTRS